MLEPKSNVWLNTLRSRVLGEIDDPFATRIKFYHKLPRHFALTKAYEKLFGYVVPQRKPFSVEIGNPGIIYHGGSTMVDVAVPLISPELEALHEDMRIRLAQLAFGHTTRNKIQDPQLWAAQFLDPQARYGHYVIKYQLKMEEAERLLEKLKNDRGGKRVITKVTGLSLKTAHGPPGREWEPVKPRQLFFPFPDNPISRPMEEEVITQEPRDEDHVTMDI